MLKLSSFCAVGFLLVQVNCCAITFKNVTVLAASEMASPVVFTKEIVIRACLKSGIGFDDSPHLFIENQNIPVLHKGAVQNLPNLVSVSFSLNEMVEIEPGAFENLPNLKNVGITGSNITAIREGVFNNLSVSGLWLWFNNLSLIEPKAFDNMNHLQTIFLDFNGIEEWDSRWFSNCDNLCNVSVTHNHLKNIPAKAFLNFNRSERNVNLSLAFNFNRNQIEYIHPEAFEGLQYLKQVLLHGNRLMQPDKALLGSVRHINNFRISENVLKCIPIEIVKAFAREGSIDVAGNPIDDDCKREIQEKYGNIVNFK